MPLPLTVGTGRAIRLVEYRSKVLRLGPYVYYPLNDNSTVAREQIRNLNGTHINVTLGVAGIGDLLTSAEYSSSSVTDIYSLSLATAFTPTLFSVSGWFYLPSGASGDQRAFILRADANNRFLIFLPSGGTTMQVLWTQGGTTTTRNFTAVADSWNHVAVAVSGSSATLWINGIEQSVITIGGTWSGTLNSANTSIGSNGVPATLSWRSRLAHWGIWLRALNSGEVISLSRL